MESGRFAEFFKNAPFDKRSVLRGFRGFSPLLFMTPRTVLQKGGFGGLFWGGAAGIGTRGAGLDGLGLTGLARDFFLFFSACPVFL